MKLIHHFLPQILLLLSYTGITAQVPVLTSSPTATAWAKQAYSQVSPAYTITATNSPNWFTVSGLPSGLWLNSETGVIFGYTEQVGGYTVHITAQNASGTASGTFLLEVIENPLPIIISNYQTSLYAKEPYGQENPFYRVEATNSPTWFSALGLPAGIFINSNTGTIFGQCETAGTYPVTLEVLNAYGSATASLTLTVKPARPVLTSPLTASGYAKIPYSDSAPLYRVVATNNPTWYEATGLPQGLWIHGQLGVIGGQTNSIGTYLITIKVTGLEGVFRETTLTLDIQPDPRPVVTSPAEVTLESGKSYPQALPVYRIEATNSPTWFTAADLPTGIFVNSETGALFGQTSLNGDHYATIAAENSFGKGPSAILLIHVIPADPTITSPTTATGFQNLTYTESNPLYVVSATNNPTWFEATGLPAGLWMHGNKGVIFGTATSIGTYTALLKVWNSTGGYTEKSLQLEIVNDPRPHLTSAISAQLIAFREYPQSQPAYQVQASPAASWITAVGLPLGFNLNSQTGAVFGYTEVRGTHWVEFNLQNSYGTNSFWVEFVTTAPRPTITSAPTATARQATVYDASHPLYTITATDNPVWYTASGLPEGLTVDGTNGKIYGMTLQDGEFSVTITAEGLDRQIGQSVISLIVEQKPFSITSPGNFEEGLGYDFSFAITTTGDPVWWESLNSLPPGLYLYQDRGVIKGIPTQIGVYQYRFRVEDNVGREIIGSLSISILDKGGRLYLVTNTSSDESVEGSLAWAVRQANLYSVGTADTVAFAIPGNGPHTIFLNNELFLRESVSIDGRTQPGYEGTPAIRIDANGHPTAFNLYQGEGSRLAGLQIYNFSSKAITTNPDADNCIIEDNYIGFRAQGGSWWRNNDAGGSAGQINQEDPYSLASGIVLVSNGNQIRNNVISGVHNGIAVGFDPEKLPTAWWLCQNNEISGNIIGADPAGLTRIGNNSDAIFLGAGAQNTLILNNLLSGNDSAGVEVLHSTAIGNAIGGNLIGLDADGNRAISNGEVGILLSFGASRNTIGGDFGPNIISGNVIAGVVIGTPAAYFWGFDNLIEGNYIGTDSSGLKVVQFDSPVRLIERDILINSQYIGIHIGGTRLVNHASYSNRLGYSFWMNEGSPLTRSNLVRDNVVGGSAGWALYLENTDNNLLQGNRIGVNWDPLTPDELVPLGNDRDGILLDSSNNNQVIGNVVMYNGFAAPNADEGQGIRIYNGSSANEVRENTIANNKNIPLNNPPEFLGELLTTGKVGRPLEFQLQATSDAVAFWSYDLPASLSLVESTGVISGIIWEHGTVESTVYAKNVAGLIAQAKMTFVVANALSVWEGESYVAGSLNTPIYHVLTATESPTWMKIVSGSLPEGVFLYNDYPQVGSFVIQGIAQSAGIFPIKIQIDNAYYRSNIVDFTVYAGVSPPTEDILATFSYEVNSPNEWTNSLLWDWDRYQFISSNWEYKPTTLIFEGMRDGIWYQPCAWLESGKWLFRSYAQFGIQENNSGIQGAPVGNSVSLVNPHDEKGRERATLSFEVTPSNEWCNVGLWDWSRSQWAVSQWIWAPSQITYVGLEHDVWYNLVIWGQASNQWLFRAYAQSGVIDSTR